MIDANHPIHTCALGALDHVVADFIRFAPSLADEARAIAIARRGPMLPLAGGLALSAPRHPRPRPAWRVPLEALKRRHRPMLPAAKDEREARLKRRRALAAACHLPQGLRPEFSTAHLSVMAVIAMATQGRRPFDASIAEIARRSFTSPSTVRAAIDTAERLGLLVNDDTRREASGRSRVNRIVIIDVVWISWLRRRYGIGSKNLRAKGGQNEKTNALRPRKADRCLHIAQTREPASEPGAARQGDRRCAQGTRRSNTVWCEDGEKRKPGMRPGSRSR